MSFVKTIELPPNALIINPEDRNSNGRYEIASGFINIFQFEIVADGQFRVPVRHLNTNERSHESFSLRAWISVDPNGIELFYRFHPTSGGLSHLIYDESIDPPPEPTKHSPMRNEHSPITFTPQDSLVPLAPGVYYYNILNMILKPNAYEISFDVPFVF